MKYQVCEITNGNLKHYYRNKKKNIAWMSGHRASMLTLEEAKRVIDIYRETEPERNLFIQADWECHFRETDRYGIIIACEKEIVV